MLDVDQWKGIVGTHFGYESVDSDCCILTTGPIISIPFPLSIVCLFALFKPLSLLTVKLIIYTTKNSCMFESWLGHSLFTVSMLIGLLWVFQLFSDPLISRMK